MFATWVELGSWKFDVLVPKVRLGTAPLKLCFVFLHPIRYDINQTWLPCVVSGT
jgi:hypothetical protein